MDDKLQKLLDEKKVMLGGCVISLDNPQWHCNDCGKEWQDKLPDFPTRSSRD
jgi:YgiT-type zinc finger domain-containing protein